MRHVCLALAALSAVAWAQPEQPTAADRQRVLQSMGEFARNYVERLPDFICTRVEQHYTRAPGQTEWKLQVKVSRELSYYGRREHYRVVQVNDAPAKKLPRLNSFSYSNGNFGDFIQDLFQPKSRAEIEWDGWDQISGKRVWVFSYRMPGGYNIGICHSILIVGTCKSTDYPYHGAIYFSEDPAIVRLTIEPENVPQVRQTQSIDYGRVSIAGAEYLLPVTDTFERLTAKLHFRNESIYRDYRKFTADSSIKPDLEGKP
jgi:hypothetical protein